jgi:hypothetical protein
MAHCAITSCCIILILRGDAVWGQTTTGRSQDVMLNIAIPEQIFAPPKQASTLDREPIPKVPSTTSRGGFSIPQAHYKSWSLFLISSPEWLLRQTNEKMSALYKQFRIFGSAMALDDEDLRPLWDSL